MNPGHTMRYRHSPLALTCKRTLARWPAPEGWAARHVPCPDPQCACRSNAACGRRSVSISTMAENNEERLKELQKQAKDDRKLIERAADVLGEIDRNDGLSDVHADVLAALRIRIEGKPRGSLDDLLTAAGPIVGKKDLGDVLGGGGEKPADQGWPVIEEKKRDWPTL